MAIKSQDNCDHDLTEIKQKITENGLNPTSIRIDSFPGENLHNSAVLVPIVLHQEQVSLLFTLRSNSLERHSGQVSFPGGIIEKYDTSAIETALRETKEEIGIGRENIQVIGQMNPFNTSTGFIVFPVVGVINSLDKLTRNVVEVDRIFCIPLNWLCDPSHSRIQEFFSADEKSRNVWYFDLYDGELLWGITAKITQELLELIKK
jgi:8-oxo-dGTP pyrophosphatase MutT (NUDIX family)